ncbi:MAG TPA: type II methionyl aminopeptidase [Candidatus Nanoarchaeia archaeon]|nr:type II methionyl aminopeptidase [Candidatus Nanoarchaeia archaeon]
MEIDKTKVLEAGKIASQVKTYARTIVKKDVPLLEIAEKIEARISELGGKPAFPVNLSINEIAAHYTPSHDDKALASGLLKVDFGVHIDGWTADNAFSLDLENSEENKRLIETAEEALNKALDIVKLDIAANQIGGVISETIESRGFSPIINLCGHSMKQYELHGGITIPNIDDGRKVVLKEGLYAIEPFATPGSGKVRDGRPSGIYELTSEKSPRSPLARELLQFIKKEYDKLPFCSRWIVEALDSKALFGLRELEANGNLHHFNQLVEVSGAKVSQAEQTILVEENKVTVTTL